MVEGEIPAPLVNNQNLWLMEGSLTENTPALQVIGGLALSYM